MEILVYLVAAVLWTLICIKKSKHLGMQHGFFRHLIINGAFWWVSMIFYLVSRHNTDYEDWDV